MDASEYFKKLNQFAKKHQGEMDPDLNNQNAINIAHYGVFDHDIVDIKDAFFVFASFNFLNASRKRNNIDTSFVSEISRRINETLKTCPSVKFYYYDSDKGRVIYVNFYSFIMSYINFPIDSNLANQLKKMPPINFDGIKKQDCASLILRNAYTQIKASNKVNNQQIIKPTSTQVNTSSGRTSNYSYLPYDINDITRDFHLMELSSTKFTASNMAVVIKTMFFMKDLIDSSNPPLEKEIEKALYREIIVNTYSVVEVVELEAGAQILNQVRNSSNHDRARDKKYLDALKKEVVILKNSPEEKFYNEYRQARNNIHLSKKQDILKDGIFAQSKVEEFFSFMSQYLEFIYDTLLNKKLLRTTR